MGSGARKAQCVLGTPLALYWRTQCAERGLIPVNECSDAVKHTRVLCEKNIKIVQTCLNA